MLWQGGARGGHDMQRAVISGQCGEPSWNEILLGVYYGDGSLYEDLGIFFDWP